ncbi:MAG: DinB family protein [Gemmataceae bacterium]
MNGSKVIETALASTQHMVNWYVNDLSDGDLLVRPTAGANHIAWQLGHLIATETRLARQVPGMSYPGLPAGFEEQHAQGMATQESTQGFLGKQQYVDLFNQTREATKAGAAKLSDADLDRPTEGQMASFAPTLAALLILVANHTMMHAGQFSVVRRKLGKPVLF